MVTPCRGPLLCWFERRKLPQDYRAIDSVQRRLPGTEHRQRPQSQTVEPLTTFQEDHLYHAAQVGRIVTEMVRPSVKGIVDKRRYGGGTTSGFALRDLPAAPAPRKTTSHSAPIDSARATLHMHDICRQHRYTDENGTPHLHDEVLSTVQIVMPAPLEHICPPNLLRGVRVCCLCSHIPSRVLLPDCLW